MLARREAPRAASRVRRRGASMGEEGKFKLTLQADQGRAVLEILTERLKRDDLDEFRAACDKLLATGQKELLIEAKDMHSISSVYIGVLINLGTQAKGSGLHLVMDTTRGIADILHKLVGDVLELKVADV
jgi:hypothetical protein